MATRNASPDSVGRCKERSTCCAVAPNRRERRIAHRVRHREEARHALMRAHGDRCGRAGGAQVVAIDLESHLTVLCWFGRLSAPLIPEVRAFARARIEARGRRAPVTSRISAVTRREVTTLRNTADTTDSPGQVAIACQEGS